MTRIVAGSAGGRRIEVPPKGTRPTSERVREAMFSALDSAMELSGARVLDLYAGSGALGLEARSRGAGNARFVEADRRAAQLLRRNAESLGLGQVAVDNARVETVLAAAPDQPYDLVFADPPYDVDNAQLARVLGLLAEHSWTGVDGLVLVERAVRSGEPPWPEPFRPMRARRYGDTAVHWAFHEGACHDAESNEPECSDR